MMDYKAYTRWSILLLIFVLILAGCQAATPTPTEEPTLTEEMSVIPAVSVSDQEVADGMVTVDEIVSDGPGWIVIHAQANGGPGPILGASAVNDGENSGVSVEIDTAGATKTLYAMLHTDAGEVGTLEFPDGPDTPVNLDGQVITPPFEVTGLPEAMGAPVNMVETDELGTFLVDEEGYTLYLFTNDDPGVSNCYEQCADAWPPLLTEGEPTVGEGVDETLLGTTERDDGSLQVTYNDWPLYYYFDDPQPGDVNGQGANDVWYLLDPSGEMIMTESAGTLVEMVETDEFGTFLVDEEGYTLYLFTNDDPGVSNCYEQCADAWPPLLTEGEPTAGEGVDETLLGTTERDDGSLQVTYNDWPLYYYFDDPQPGDVNGQGANDVWYLLDPAGEMIMTAMMEEEAMDEGGDSEMSAETFEVGIEDSRFTPGEVTINVGDTVVWTSSASFNHTVTSDDGTFSSGTLSGGNSFDFTFTEPGTYAYYCDFHGGPGGTGMSGVITVNP